MKFIIVTAIALIITVVSWQFMSSAFALQQIIYTNNPYPSLYFNYRLETGRCQYNVQIDTGNNYARTNTNTESFEQCFNGFATDVFRFHPDYNFPETFNTSDSKGVIPDGVPQVAVKFFWLLTYWLVLHTFYSLIPG